VKLREESTWCKPTFVEEQLQPGAVSSGVRECERNEKGPGRTCGWSGEFSYRFAKMFGTNFNGHSVYESDQHSSDCRSFDVLLQDLMPPHGYSQTWFRIMVKGRILLP